MNKKFFTYIDLYRNYSYKKVDYETYALKRKPAFYVNKKDDSNHEYALTYNEYKRILFSFLDELLEYLLEGKTYNVPCGMGSMSFIKIHKSNAKFINYYQTCKQYGKENKGKPKSEWKLVYHRNDHSDQFGVKFKWNAASSLHKPSRKMWTYKLSRTAIKRISERLMSDVNIINKINE